MADLRRYFDDIQQGEEYESPGRTVTETDIVIFAGLSGDYNVLHTDAEFMKRSIFGERIAHGLLGLAMQAGRSPPASPACRTTRVVGRRLLINERPKLEETCMRQAVKIA